MVLLPWDPASTVGPIVNISSAPTGKNADLLNTFCYRIGQPKKQDKLQAIWTNVCLGFNHAHPEQMETRAGQPLNAILQEEGIGAYLSPVQGAAHSSTIGRLIFTGDFSNPRQISQEIMDHLSKKYPNDNFQVGARISAIPELRPSPGKTDRSSWLHNRPRKCVELLCQTDQLRKLKPIFNNMYSPKTTTIFTRPSFRYTIFIPEMALLLGGPKLAQRRQAMLANHERFTTHLKYIDQDATAMIEELDLPYTPP
ncbi:MAG TPA: hypothetical protein V6D20_21025, partial [Candidatus Obscuribacterales bacterium]